MSYKIDIDHDLWLKIYTDYGDGGSEMLYDSGIIDIAQPTFLIIITILVG